MKNLIYMSVFLVTLLGIAACGQNPAGYSITDTSQSFKQNSASTVNDRIDMLWVVDNSSSMSPLQQNMTTNFNSFINQFVTKGFDFHLAVTTTDTYLSESQFQNNPNLAKFVDGVGGTTTGIFDILSTTPNLINIFVTNASQGANGSGDERAFSSMRDALSSSLNTGFLRTNSYFAIVILSDEDDFSQATRPEYSWLYQGGVPDHAYEVATVENGVTVPANPNIDSVASYESYLDTLTGSTGATRRYGVSAITVMDNTCLQSHLPASPSSVIGQRYMDIASDTNGIVGSICDASYATALANIQQNILQLGTQFYLQVLPNVATITVAVDGVSIPESSTNGWQYNTAANSIVFYGSAVPSANAAISINFQPANLNF